MTQMTEIPEYEQFIKQANARDESLDDIIAATMKTIAKQAHALAQSIAPQADEDRAAQVERVQEDTGRVLAEFADPRGHAARRLELCELLRLPRVCALDRCRRSQCCRGGGRCRDAVEVPEPVFARRVLADAGGAAAVDHQRTRERAHRLRGVGRRDGGRDRGATPRCPGRSS